MGLEKREAVETWFDFFNHLQREPTNLWSEDVSKIFNLINRYQPEEIIGKEICGVPTVVFIHSTKKGRKKALGGTRRRTYFNMANFFRDGLKLSPAMTFKAIWARIEELGGGKAVIFGSEEEMTKDFLKGYAEFLNEINAPRVKFITGEDVGFGEEFVDIVAQYSPYITGKSRSAGGLGDPSPVTAEGNFLATEAIVEQSGIFSGTLRGKIAAQQGAGKVGLPLIEKFLKKDVNVYFSEKDGDPAAENRAREAVKLGAIRVSQDAIFRIPCHIAVPAAMGGVINKITIPGLSWMCRLIIGPANNILDTPEDGVKLHQRRIYFATDYVVNRWGLEWVNQERVGITDVEEAKKNLTDIVPDILNIFSISREKNFASNEVADIISGKVLNDEAQSIEEAIEQLRAS